MKKINKLTYITYQTFPANTANSLQTITNIAEIVKQGVEVDLIFPSRDSSSSDKIDVIKDFYGIEEEFQIIKLKHRLPFGKIKYFNKIAYHLSHYIWSKTHRCLNNHLHHYLSILYGLELRFLQC